MTKQQHLQSILAECGSVCVGYSGGVDSAYLAVAALDVLGPDHVLAVTGRSASYPDVQWDTARRVAQQFGVPHLEINTDEMSDLNYVANPSNRCYFCKTELWSKLLPVAQARGLAQLIDGANADDASDYRPGAQAARERGVRSPLMEAGLTKREIRELSQARGLPTWDQPSSPCLSSRLQYGLAVTPARLRQVEAAEQMLRDVGLREFRVRHHGDVARIEIALEEMSRAIDVAPLLASRIASLGFVRVLLDVDGYRRGALNSALHSIALRRTDAVTDVSAAGQGADIAIVDAPLSDLERVRERSAQLRGSGFRYVTIDIARSA